jgi:ABC-type lipoprotein release transport system permease subunit
MLSKLYLIRKELGGGKFISFIVFCVILLSVTAIISFNVLSGNFNNYIKNNFAAAIPPDEIKVKPGESKSIFLFSTGTGKELNGAAISRIARISGVKKIDPVMAVTVPTSATIYFFSFQYRTDLICAGASYKFVENDLKNKEMRDAWIKGTHEKGIPVLVPKALIDSYNNGLAAANGLPEIVPDKLSGLKFKLSFGRSSVNAYEGAYDSSSVVAGYTDKVNITGLVIPVKAADEINKKFSKTGRYMFALVNVKDHKYFEQVKNQIKNMGFVVETGESLSSEILKLKVTVNAFITLMISLVSVLAVVTTALCSVTAVWGRIDYYRILRTLGASKFFIALTILIKFAIMGFLASWCGIYLFEFLKIYILKTITVPGVKLSLDISAATKATILTAGTVIPVAASLPAIIRMFSVKLDNN